MAHVRDHLEKFRAFAVVVRLGSFRKAAARLRVSQPALSQSVQTLEAVLGKRLLVRTSRGVVPTEEGELLREFSDRLTLDLEALEQRLVAADEPMTGPMRIGSFESLTVSFFPGFVAHVATRFPKLVVSIASATAADLPEMLLDRRVQLTVSDTPKAAKHVVTHELFADRYAFFAGKDADRRTLARLPLVVVPDARDDAGRSVSTMVAEATQGRRPTIELTTFEAVKAFALRGVGIGVLPLRVARAEARDGRLRGVVVPGAPAELGEHRIVAAIHARDRSNPRVGRLLEEMKRYARQAD